MNINAINSIIALIKQVAEYKGYEFDDSYRSPNIASIAKYLAAIGYHFSEESKMEEKTVFVWKGQEKILVFSCHPSASEKHIYVTKLFIKDRMCYGLDEEEIKYLIQKNV